MQTISPETVRRALADLSRDRAPRTSPLIDLCAVSRELRRQGMSDSTAARMYLMGRLLSAVAESNLADLRAISGVGSSTRSGPAAVAADFSVDHPELEAWSAVYHVYLRPDLNIDLRQLTTMLGDRHRRTIQRRLRRGVLSLTRALFDTEAEALAADRRDVATWALPRLPETAAEDLPTARAAASAMVEDGPAVLVISGAPGSGKTILAALVARELSRSEGLDVCWIDEAEQPRRLTELGLDADGRDGRPRGPTPSRVVAVLDDCDDLSVVRMLESLARPPCPIIVTTICTTASANWSRRIMRHPLRPDQALERVQAAALALDPPAAELTDHHLTALVEAAEGSRLALQMAIQHLRVMSLDTVVSSLRGPSGFGVALSERLWRRRWLQAPPGIRDVILAGSDGGRRSMNVLVDAAMRPETLALAAEMGLLICEGGVMARSYALPAFLGQYLRLERGRVTTVARGYAAAPPRTAAVGASRAAAS